MRRRGVGILAVWTLLASTSACEKSPTEPAADRILPDVSAYTTPAIASALRADGTFKPVYDAPAPEGDHLSRARALDLGTEFVEQFLRDGGEVPPGAERLADVLEGIHGRDVDWDNVVVSSTGVFRTTASFTRLPASVPSAVHNRYGPYYIMALVEDENRVGTLAVAARAVHLRLVGGRLTGLEGGEFRANGVPFGADPPYPLAPEHAVEAAFQLLGVRVSGVPIPMKPREEVEPIAVKWRLPLEDAVEVRRISTQEIFVVDTVYVGQAPSLIDPVGAPARTPRLFVAAPDQPTEGVIRMAGASDSNDFIWDRKAGIAVDFLEVEPIR